MKRALAAILGSMLLAAQAPAATITYVAVLDGPSENPPNASLGTGTATLVVDTTADTASLTVSFGGLSSPTAAAHIHCCTAPPANVGVAIGSNGFPTGVLQGSFSATYDLLDATIYGSAFLTSAGSAVGARDALLAGLASGTAYYNIHTSLSQGGEIRGFFAVPEPAAALLLGAAGASAWLARRRLGRAR